ncbi:hypothetical protein Esti_004031 [Eimeria stiedai]
MTASDLQDWLGQAETDTVRAEGKAANADLVESLNQLGAQASALVRKQPKSAAPSRVQQPTPGVACGGRRISKSPRPLLGSRPCSPNLHKAEEQLATVPQQGVHPKMLQLVVEYRDLFLDESPDDVHPPRAFHMTIATIPNATVRMAPEDRHKTAFRTFIEWCVMPFGLESARSTFQATMNSILFDTLRQEVLIYMDDVLVYTAAFDKHLRLLDSVLARLLQHKMYPKLTKCKFAAQSNVYLGCRVRADGIYPSTEKVPLQQLLKQKASSQWTAAHSSAVQALRDRLIHYTKLSLPDVTKPFILRTDASGVAIGSVLGHDGKPLGLLSKRLSDAGMRYSTHDQELPAIVRALECWRHSLVAAEVTVYTDNQALQYLAKLRCDRPIRGRLARWLDFLADLHHLNIGTNQLQPTWSPMHYLAAQDPQHASSKVLSVSSFPPPAPQKSCFSASNPPEPAVRTSLFLVRAKVGRRARLQIGSNTNSGPSNESPSPLLHDNVLSSPQSSLSDPEMQGAGDEAWEAALQRCREFAAAYKRVKETQPEPVLVPDPGRFKLVERVLCIQLQGLWLICVPHFPSFRQRILYQHRDLPTAGHLGISKTYNQIAMKYYWKGTRDAWHPQTDGQTERANRTIESRCCISAFKVVKRSGQTFSLHWNLPTTAPVTLPLAYPLLKLCSARILYDPNILSSSFPPTPTPPMTKAFRLLVDGASAHLEQAKRDQNAFADASRRPLEFSVGPFGILERIGPAAY